VRGAPDEFMVCSCASLLRNVLGIIFSAE